MNRFEFYSAIKSEVKIDYHGNVYEVIETNYRGVILQSVNDDTSISITYRELMLNAEVI